MLRLCSLHEWVVATFSIKFKTELLCIIDRTRDSNFFISRRSLDSGSSPGKDLLLFYFRITHRKRRRIKMMSAQQEEEFVAFENKVDEVMQILNLMSSDDKPQAEEGIEIANK